MGAVPAPQRVLEAGLRVLVVLNHKGGTLSQHKPREGLALVKAAFDAQGVDATIVAARGRDISSIIRRGLDSPPPASTRSSWAVATAASTQRLRF